MILRSNVCRWIRNYKLLQVKSHYGLFYGNFTLDILDILNMNFLKRKIYQTDSLQAAEGLIAC